MRLHLLSLLLLMPAFPIEADVPMLRGLSRSQLLQYRTSDGRIQRVTRPEEWEKRRQEAVTAFQSIAGKLPGPEQRVALSMRIEEEVDCGGYVRRLISYASMAGQGARVPAYLCVPKTALAGQPAPAVLCLHPTDHKIGHKVVVGLGGKPHRQYAAELAERGYVTLAPSYPLLAEYQPDLKALGFTSGTMKAIWDNLRGLDLLESLPEVRKQAGFGAIGHSLGGHNAIFTAVFEPRIKVVISSCGFDSLLDYYGGNLKGWVQERYMLKMGDFLGSPQDVPFDYYELIAALAPRRVYVNAPLKDSNFRWDSVDRIVAAAAPVFKLLGADGGLTVRHPDCDHDFPDAERFEAYEVIRQVLGEP
jgi:dienelactone hydrolase